MRMEVDKRCKMCGTEFKALNIVRRFCCVKCRSAFYKAQARDRKIEMSDHETVKMGIKHKKALVNSPFIKVGDATFLLGCSKSTIYHMINTDRLRATNFSKRLIRLLRDDIFSILDERIRRDYELMEQRRVNREDQLAYNYYRIAEAMSIFKKSKEAMYAYCRRHGIAKVKIGREILLSKDGIEKLHRKFKGSRYVGLEREREVNRKLTKRRIRMDECYSMKECTIVFGRTKELLYGIFARRDVPKLKRGRNIFIPKTVIGEMFDLIKKRRIVRKITLRKKTISKGRNSLFLDVYPPVLDKNTNKLTRKFYLGLYVYDTPATYLERQHNKETWALAEAIRVKRQLDILRMHYSALFHD